MQSETLKDKPANESRKEKRKLDGHKPIEQAGIKDPDPGASVPPPGNH